MRMTLKRGLAMGLCACLACAVALALSLAAPALATGVPDIGRKGSITATVTTDDTLQSGRLELIRVASFSAEGQLVLDEEFAGSGVDLGALDSASEWRQAASELASWADAHQIVAVLSGEGIGPGSATYGFGNLDCGLYLVRGFGLASNSRVYDCGSTLLSVPTLEGGEWSYDVTAELKVSVSEKDAEPEGPGQPEGPAEPADADGDVARSGSGDLAGTGDHTSVVPVIVCVVAGCASVLLAVIRGRRK